MDKKLHNDFEEAYLENDIVEVRKFLQNQRLDPTWDNSDCICQAAKLGYVELVQIFLEDGRANPGDYYNYPIRYAAISGRLEVVKLLLPDPRVNPSDQENKALEWALEEIEKPGGIYNSDDLPPSVYAEIARILLKDLRVIHDLAYLRKLYYASDLVPQLFNEAAIESLTENPTLAKYFVGLVSPEILGKYGEAFTEFDMF